MCAPRESTHRIDLLAALLQLYLTSNVSSSDFNMGYSMTGTLERGCKKTNSFQMTHFAVIRRRDYEKAYEDPNPT